MCIVFFFDWRQDVVYDSYIVYTLILVDLMPKFKM